MNSKYYNYAVKIAVFLKIINEPYQITKKELTSSATKSYFKTFGNLNNDKIYYVIQQESKRRGFFSLLASVIYHLDIAEKNGFIPIIDFKNFPTAYTDNDEFLPSNIWNRYFEPVSSIDLSEVYKSKHVIFSHEGCPEGYNSTLSEEKRLKHIYKKYIKINHEVEEEISILKNNLFKKDKILGVHFRGQEFRTARKHGFPPSKIQIYNTINRCINEYNFDKVFVVTEDSEYLKFLVKNFGEKIIYTEAFRTNGINAYNLNKEIRHNHIYLLGKEVLVDAYLLSECHGIIGCTSNVFNFSKFINDSGFDPEISIINGLNSSNPLFSKFLWFYKATVPEWLGGFNKNP